MRIKNAMASVVFIGAKGSYLLVTGGAGMHAVDREAAIIK